jgi:ParB/RepB/Spo0J family partition protein
MDSTSNRMEIVWIEAERLAPNPWNPNHMGPGLRAKLARELGERGFAAPIVVRPQGEDFEIVDGEHRWRVARELGLREVPCVIAAAGDTEARIKTLQFNGLRGENDSEELAALLAELAEDLTLEELAEQLPWTVDEVRQLAELAKREELDGEALFRLGPEFSAPEDELFSVVVTRPEAREIRAAVAAAREPGASDGSALAAVCREFLSVSGVE